MAQFEHVGMDLVFDLKRIAAIHQQGRVRCQHHRHPRRSVEAGDPRQSVGVGGDVLAKIFVGVGHDEPGQIAVRQFAAQVDQPALELGVGGRPVAHDFAALDTKESMTFLGPDFSNAMWRRLPSTVATRP